MFAQRRNMFEAALWYDREQSGLDGKLARGAR
jgi:hypothetical protein